MNNRPEIYEKLMLFAMRVFRADPSLAEEAAADSVLMCVEKQQLNNFAYGKECVRNYILEQYRNRKVRNLVSLSDLEEDDDSGEPQVIKSPWVLPNQPFQMHAAECIEVIGRMSDEVRPVMELVAQEWSADEIAADLDLPKNIVSSRTKYARRVLRELDGYGADTKRGHRRLIGIRRRHRKWEASIRHGNEYIYLGHYDTASDAAKAYDKAAKEIHGATATLNFPGSATR